MSAHLHFVVLQHGYHGTDKDFEYLASLLQRKADLVNNKNGNETKNAKKATKKGNGETKPYEKLFILNSNVNHALKTDQGVAPCGRRLVEYIVDNVQKQVQICFRQQQELKPSSQQKDTLKGLNEQDKLEIHLQFSFIGHSMGGLITRAALPSLERTLTSLYTGGHSSPMTSERSNEPAEHKYDTVNANGAIPFAPQFRLAEPIRWKLLCMIGVPHVGVAHMPSTLKAGVGRRVGRWCSQGLYDMYLDSPTLTEELLTEECLSCLDRFESKVAFNAVNDNTVMGYSSIGCVSPAELTILRQQSKVDTKASTITTTDSSYPIPTSTTLEQLREHTYTLELGLGAEPDPQLWPEGVLPRERSMIQKLLPHLSPLEVHSVDFTPAVETHIQTNDNSNNNNSLGWWGRRSLRWAASNFAHRALTCKAPAAYPEVFGFVSEFIADHLVSL